ncbi:hypothetical protein M8C21_000462, partial [Ambrosia artemisiifolia]
VYPLSHVSPSTSFKTLSTAIGHTPFHLPSRDLPVCLFFQIASHLHHIHLESSWLIKKLKLVERTANGNDDGRSHRFTCSLPQPTKMFRVWVSRLSDILIPVEYDVTEVFNVHRFTCSLPTRSLQITMSAMILLISSRSRNWHDLEAELRTKIMAKEINAQELMKIIQIIYFKAPHRDIFQVELVKSCWETILSISYHGCLQGFLKPNYMQIWLLGHK